METWKAMAWTAVVVVLFGAVVSVVDISVSGPTVLAILAGVAVGSVIFYAISKKGYQFGRRLGEQMSEDE
ncbi:MULTISPECIES: hypothetical protein [unclassified Halorhabdus]|uniref:hypothetical protein n=1 Tax=unclassified Halorhabdus TaxID=2621901 RepID=UPI0023D9DCAD|nr:MULTISPECIES: hypothetical protein [unclassified Halorhabdus]WEL18787.1 putative membrane protein [Halorhabdus sp. SVX81]WEL22524.1 putative membrane protein [Halorhabdus sp. BNX81]